MKSSLLALATAWMLAAATSAAAPAAGPEPGDFDRLLSSFPLVDEIDAATQPPVHQFPDDASRLTRLLDRPARCLPPGDLPKGMAWVLGRGKHLQPGQAYLLEVEYPDDVPRTLFLANRGADLVRGWATGPATGDARQQYTQPSLESLAYSQSGSWQTYRCLFVLHHRFQGLLAQRDPKPGGRPFTPADGFHVLVFQTRLLNDPRSEGAAVGKIRLRRVPDLDALAPAIEPLPAGLPRRRVFLREEMADEAVQGRAPADRAFPDPVDWYVHKARLLRALGFRTFAKDLLEFGFNQGFDSGDQNWFMNAQPPLTDLWDRLVPRLAALGLDVLPYYEYKGALGLRDARPVSLAWQRRAEKLYHAPPNTRYTDVWWTEDHNADLTDPDTLADACRLLDRTVLAHKDKAPFAGAWFRVRDNHLPLSFADATVARFRADHPNDAQAKAASRAALIASYEGDRALYDRYVAWWLARRADFFSRLRDHLAKGLHDDRAQLLFTPWTSEPIPMLRDPASGPHGHPVQITTDDPAWWDAFARQQPGDSWFRWSLVPTAYDKVVAADAYARSLRFREPVSPAPNRREPYHSAPGGDPETYRDRPGPMLTFPTGRLCTVARPDLLDAYRSRSGLTLVRHYPLNEDNHDHTKGRSNLPFDGQVGYVCVDVDRAGPHLRLLEARAVATGDPVNLGMLCASAFSTGFPDELRRFHQAFLSVPALPSHVLPRAADHPEVVVRAIPTPADGTYFFVVSTGLRPVESVSVRLPGEGVCRDLIAHRDLPTPLLRLTLSPGELRSYRLPPSRPSRP